MKKAVFYLEETTQDGKEGYIVRGWKNVLKAKELPNEYFTGLPFFYLSDKGDIIKVAISFDSIYIEKNKFFTKAGWDKLYSYMLDAGHRLSKILHKPKIIKVEI
jgi:hypothetical protein